MALSNWDTLAFDLNGPCPSGRLTDISGLTLEMDHRRRNRSADH